MNTIPDDSTTSDSTITQCSEDRILDKEVKCKIEQIDGTQSSAIADVDRSEENNDVASSAKQENNNVSKPTSEMCRQPSAKINQDIKMTNHETLRNVPNEIQEIHKNDTAVSNTSAPTTSAPTTTTLPSRKTLTTSARRALTKNESSPSRNCYEYHWKKLAKLTATECSNLHIAVTHECKAVRTSASNHKKSREKCWASMFGGGMIGTYDTKEEAIKRAVWYAIHIFTINIHTMIKFVLYSFNLYLPCFFFFIYKVLRLLLATLKNHMILSHHQTRDVVLLPLFNQIYYRRRNLWTILRQEII